MKKNINTTPFDRMKVPPKQNFLIMPLLWLWCFVATRSGHLKIHKIGMKGIKPPFIVLGTHQAFMDFYVTPLTIFPYRANYVSELEGFEYYGEWKYRQIGCLGTRKFVTDSALVKNIKCVMDRKGILVLYPEARYANVGTSSPLPLSVGKLCKYLNVPVVALNMKGNYLQSPIWNLKKRKGVKLDATISLLFDKNQLKDRSAEDITKDIENALTYDEYQYQKKAGIKITEKWRAEGLHMPLYMCIKCGSNFSTKTSGDMLYCTECGEKWTLTPEGDLENTKSHEIIAIPHWYEWERQETQKEIKNGIYGLNCRVHIESLPNAVNFIDLGEGTFSHHKHGFTLTFTDYGKKEAETITFPSKSCFSVHTEYNYRNKGQCITLSTPDNTYFIYPLENGFNATKIQFAAEYCFKNHF